MPHQSTGSMSHKRHRSTGGPKAKNQGRRNPKAVAAIARAVNLERKRLREIRERNKPTMHASLQALWRES